jgi:hypothetical protein
MIWNLAAMEGRLGAFEIDVAGVGLGGVKKAAQEDSGIGEKVIAEG